jgi:hypothetical protein
MRCGANRFEAMRIADNGDMYLKCIECGAHMVAGNAWPDTPDRNGNVYAPGGFKGIPDARRSDKTGSS